uniref:Reverse transcriptase n=1 Tax=Tanacetum cinerariifolium TaxID=118510 RepID=A0A699H4P9_TANCI|nr:reverse transcriptase [Tanacetum cinerariifolium]
MRSTRVIHEEDGWFFSHVYDHRELNKLIVKKRYPLRRIDDLFDQLREACPFLKIDFWSGYHQLRVHEDAILKTAFRTRYRNFESTIMPFGLTSAPTVFINLRKRVCKPYLDKFVNVLFVDILIYSKTKKEHKVHLKVVLESPRKEKLLLNPLTSLTERNLKYEWSVEEEKAFQTLKMIVSYFDNANVVSDVLSRKKRVKSRRVRGMILTAQSKAFKQENEWNSGGDQLRLRWMIYLVVLADATESVRDAIGFKDWKSSLTGLELVQETTNKVVVVKENPKAARDRQKSCVVCGRKLAPRYVRPFEILKRTGLVAYRLRLPEKLNSVHGIFHVSNLKRFLADANSHVPLDEIKANKTLRFVEEPVEIMDREIKKLKCRKIALVKVRWNSKHGPGLLGNTKTR